MPQLRQADARLLAIASASDDAIVGAGSTGRIVFWNRAAARIFGWTESEILGQPFTVLLPDRYEDTPPFELAGLVEGCRRDASEFPMQLSFGGEAADGSFTAVMRDLTELENRNRELERSNAALEQFAAIASHDLSAPLRTIQAFLRLLERRHADELSDEAQDFVAHAVHASIRMQRLIDDLLIYSRVGQGARMPEEVDTNGIVAEVVEALGAGGRVVWDALPVVLGHDSELEHLFQNLVGNALKFVPPGRDPHVEIRAERADGHWCFTVEDNGIGLDPDRAEQLFAAFQRGDTGKEYDGTGVGLAIARKVVEHHGGRIWVERKDGDGSRFCFTLPA